ncbi:hypothetical protein BHE74_00000337 [Ensete ventricosum]|nr:hypothetical protein GW17_00060272 [Ensete ventricosum]RWW90635.1 hypothetical protein BHE74_00000337 [Ensete ventricosum]
MCLGGPGRSTLSRSTLSVVIRRQATTELLGGSRVLLALVPISDTDYTKLSCRRKVQSIIEVGSLSPDPELQNERKQWHTRTST